MSVVFMLLVLLAILVVAIAPLVGIGVGTYFIFRNRVPRGGLIALVIGIPLAVAFVVAMLVAAIAVIASVAGA